MANLDTQVIGQAGAALTFDPASAGGDTCTPAAGVKALFKNDDASAHTVTIATPGTVDGDLAIADRSVTIPAGAIVPVPITDRYRDRTTGLASLSYDAVTSLSVAVMR